MDLVSFNFDHDAFGSKLVDAFRLSHEHDLELLPVGVVINVLCQLFVCRVALGWDIDCDSCFEVDNVSLEGVDLFFTIFKGLEELKRLLFCLVALLLNSLDEVCCR